MLLPSAFLAEKTRLKFAHTQQILVFVTVEVSLSEPIWRQQSTMLLDVTPRTHKGDTGFTPPLKALILERH